MKMLSALLITAAVTLSSLAMAEGGGDRTFARMQAAIESSTQTTQLALQQQPRTIVMPADETHSHANC